MMKKLLIFANLCLLFCGLNAQTLNLSFTAQNEDGQYVKLDSVQVKNVTRGWSETLIWPDTVLIVTENVGVAAQDEKNAFALYQNVPNPFDSSTSVDLKLPQNEKVKMEVFDIHGKKIVELQRSLPAGVHAFKLTLSQPQTYLLSVTTSTARTSIKMIQFGKGADNVIEYTGLGDAGRCHQKALKAVSHHEFAKGDIMSYVGYTTVDNLSCMSTEIKQAQNASEAFVLTFKIMDGSLPTVKTDSVSNISFTGASLHATIISDGYPSEGIDSILQRGFCWDTQSNPTMESHFCAVEGQGDTFAAELSDLTEGTTYYVKAFAKNNLGVAYGNELSFTTLKKTVPEVILKRVDNISHNTANIYAAIVSDGNAAVTEYGFCWDTVINPTLASSHMVADNGTANFSATLKELKPATKYFVRAYATNSVGTAYSNLAYFTTNKETVSDLPQQILCCEQATQTYNIYDFKTGNKIWSWAPTSDRTVQLSGYRFNNVSEAKPVFNGTCMMVVASGGGAAIVRLSDKKVLFLANPIGNTHSIELLPGNRVVCASSTGNTLKVYNIDTNNVKQTSPVFTMTFEDGHNVLWDKKRNCLWSAGHTAMYQLSYNETTGKLTTMNTYPFPDSCIEGHDLIKIWNQDRYMLTTWQKTFEFDPNTNTFTLANGFQGEGSDANPNNIKSISTGPAGFKTICVVPEEQWWTSYVTDFYTGEHVFTCMGGKIYKARWWLWEEE